MISVFLWGMFTGACLLVALAGVCLLVMVRNIAGEFERDEREPLLSNSYPRFGP